VLYEVATKALNQAVKRNIERFPKRFIFQLTKDEWQFLKSQIVTSKIETRGGTPKLPFAFTEHGVTMVASVLRSKKAVKMNIAIVEAFIALKEFAQNYKELSDRLDELETIFNRRFADVNEALRFLMDDKQSRVEWSKRKKIGFKNSLTDGRQN